MPFTIKPPDLGKALAETEKDIKRAVTSGILPWNWAQANQFSRAA